MRVAVDYGLAIPVLAMTPQNTAVYLDRGRNLGPDLMQALRSAPFPKLRSQRGLLAGQTYEETRSRYLDMIGSLEPGVNYIFSHPADESAHSREDTPYSQQRAWDAALFADVEVQRFYDTRQNLRFTTWREIMQRYNRWLAKREQ